MKKEISVIIPAFNRSWFLKKSVKSVLAQTYKNFEIIVIDDGSTENLKTLIADLGKDIIYLRQSNKGPARTTVWSGGPAAARNIGIKNSQGEFIAFLDSDDLWESNKLSVQIKAMKKNPSYLISYTQETWYKNKQIFNQKKKHKKFSGYIFDKCLLMCVVGMSTVIMKRQLFERIGLFDESLPCCEDYDFWLRVGVQYPFLLIDKPLTLKNGGRNDQVSYVCRKGMDIYRIKAIIKMLGNNNSLTGQQNTFLIKELSKKCQIYGNGCIKHGKVGEGKYYLKLSQHPEILSRAQVALPSSLCACHVPDIFL